MNISGNGDLAGFRSIFFEAAEPASMTTCDDGAQTHRRSAVKIGAFNAIVRRYDASSVEPQGRCSDRPGESSSSRLLSRSHMSTHCAQRIGAAAK